MKYTYRNNQLKKYREQKGYTQKEVALRLGLKTEQPIANWEEGKSTPRFLNLMRLSLIYRTGPEKLYPDFFEKIQRALQRDAKSRENPD